jgi:hypothetical protein
MTVLETTTTVLEMIPKANGPKAPVIVKSIALTEKTVNLDAMVEMVAMA